MISHCQICKHEHKQAIEAAASGHSRTTVAAQFGVAICTLWNHLDHHLPKTTTKPPDLADPATFRAAVTELAQKGLDLLDSALTHNRDLRSVARAFRESLAALTAIARLFTPHTKPTGVDEKFIHTPEWSRIQTLILEALWPFPDARRAVVNAIKVAEA